jgi:exopolysaccharide biosynthesis protein
MNIKKRLYAAVAAFLAVVALPVGAMAAFSTNLLDNPTFSHQENGIRYAEQSVNEGGEQKLFYGEYNTTSANAEYEWVIHSIRNGNKTTLSTVKDIALDYEQKTGRKVMLATNGDYFFNTGDNVESYVKDGIVLTKGSYQTKHCIGFDNAGKVVVGRMTEVEKRLMVVIDGKRTFFNIDKINEEPGENEIAIYTNPGTHTIEGAGKYKCTSTSSNLTSFPVYGECRRMTTGSVADNEPLELKSGQFAVVVKGENAQFFYDSIQYGVEVNLVEIPAGDFAGCTWVLGGYDILVDNGTVNTSRHTDNSGNANAPRTFIGFKEDGTGFVCVVDGRGAGGSVGVTVNKEAQLAKALGAKFALELDGGGSSTAIVRINDTLTLRNKPSDGSMRRISNAIMLVEKEKVQEPETPPTEPTEPTTPATQPTAPATKPTTPTQPGVNPTAVVAIAVMGGLVGVAVIALIVLAVVKRKK